MAEQPIKLTIAALGGQGGGVLADWLVEIAEATGSCIRHQPRGAGPRLSCRLAEWCSNLPISMT